jgi:hypothetical protein
LVVTTHDAVLVAGRERTQEVDLIVRLSETASEPEAKAYSRISAPLGPSGEVVADFRCGCIATPEGIGFWSRARRWSRRKLRRN